MPPSDTPAGIPDEVLRALTSGEEIGASAAAIEAVLQEMRDGTDLLELDVSGRALTVYGLYCEAASAAGERSDFARHGGAIKAAVRVALRPYAAALLKAREALRECLPYVEEYACGKPHPVVDTARSLLPPSPGAGAKAGR
jgi:hypothetical protein